jgi:CRISPR-associated protein Cas2
MSNKRPAKYWIDQLRLMQQAGLEASPPISPSESDVESLPSLQERVDALFQVVNRNNRPKGSMLFFIMYDITSNKVRSNVVKYLLRKGCTRIQKSVFLADLPPSECEAIKQDLTEVQSLYENHDSIMVCPISTDILKSMRVIGQNIRVDIIAHTKNTLFF